MNHFTIIITAYNCEQYIKRCLDSVINQDYPKYDIVITDASSTDTTLNTITQRIFKIPSILKEGVTSQLKTCQKRKYQLENIIHSVYQTNPNHNTICVSLDGDDRLAHNNVLTKLNEVYQDSNVWMTYGSFKEENGTHCPQYWTAYPDEVVKTNTFRSYRPWLASHLRTWRAKLFMHIRAIDFLNKYKQWPKTAGDMYFMIPMLELAGTHSKHIPDILYIYNTDNPNNDYKTSRQDQIQEEEYVRTLKPYQPLEVL